jgi:hypothetical protein
MLRQPGVLAASDFSFRKETNQLLVDFVSVGEKVGRSKGFLIHMSISGRRANCRWVKVASATFPFIAPGGWMYRNGYNPVADSSSKVARAREVAIYYIMP